MNIKRCVVVLILLWPAGLRAGDMGAYQFLRVGVTARATSLGDAFTSRFGDVSTFMYNPAGVALLQGRQASASYMNHLLDISSGFIGYAQPWADYGVFGTGIVYFNYGDFDGYDASGHSTGNFSASDFAWNFFYANTAAENTYYGINMKFVRSSIDRYTSTALAMDLGVIYRLPQYETQFGISLLNVGQATKAYIQTKEALPVSLQMGVSKKLERAPITVSAGLADLNVAGNRLERFSIGAELTPKEYLFIRAGYNNQRHSELQLATDDFMDRIAGFSAGLGFAYRSYNVDYSFASWGIGTINRFSVTMNF